MTDVPELPEVETIRRQLAPGLRGATVGTAWGFDSPKFLEAPDASGHRIEGLRRRGKYLIADLLAADGTRRELVVHLGMTGRLAIGDRAPTDHPHLRAWWDLDGGRRLTFHDARRFGRIAVVEAGHHDRLPTLARLGPEPLSPEFTPQRLRLGLTGRRALKTALMDQRIVAGVGNIYADEALWAAGISPVARRLSADRASRLHAAIVAVLRSAIDHGGTTLRDYRDARGEHGTHQARLNCYGRAGLPCARCGQPLSRRVVDARGTTFCRRCQR